MRAKKSQPKRAALTARYRVIAEIEHNGVVYVPLKALSATGQVKDWEQRTAVSRASVRKDRKGQEGEYERYQVSVDKSGCIRVREGEAAALFAQSRSCPI